MPFETVEQPVPGSISFSGADDASILTQAAVLLAIGAQLRGDNKRVRLASAGPYAVPVPLPDEDVSFLGLPPLQESHGRIDSAHIRQLLFSRYNLPVPPQAVLSETPIQDLAPLAAIAAYGHDGVVVLLIAAVRKLIA
jgi:hypothetical protein